MKKILVTGGVGFIGSNLLMELKKLNYQLYSLDNYSSGTKKNEIEGVIYINKDITQIVNLKNDFESEIHLVRILYQMGKYVFRMLKYVFNFWSCVFQIWVWD